ncbi:ABC transporter ATP-binding protein [Arcobacter sp. YIC-464]|uniref:ABC transporter ATP-binding protein n=1 Tax=Arcobacter sp. YIC-464 TaxID=3376631 RepID=UPI003C23D0A6
MIEAKNISFFYGKEKILDDISLKINKGDIISLLGPNGTGKSTLIKILLGLLKAKNGEVLLENKNISTYKKKSLAKKIAYVPQSSSIPFAYDVLDIVLMGRIAYQGFFSRYSKQDEEIAINSLKKLGILYLKDKLFSKLSGGEQQLVLIARALTQEASFFIMDEPVTGLDYGNQIRLLETIKSLASQGFTFLKTTHYPDHAFLVSNEVILMKNGKIIEAGNVEKVITQKNLEHLYGIDVNIDKTKYGFNICIPNFKHKEEYV